QDHLRRAQRPDEPATLQRSEAVPLILAGAHVSPLSGGGRRSGGGSGGRGRRGDAVGGGGASVARGRSADGRGGCAPGSEGGVSGAVAELARRVSGPMFPPPKVEGHPDGGPDLGVSPVCASLAGGALAACCGVR